MHFALTIWTDKFSLKNSDCKNLSKSEPDTSVLLPYGGLKPYTP
jgi:hypothetical protein